MAAQPHAAFIRSWRERFGERSVLTAQQDKAPYEQDWRRRYTSPAECVAFPPTTQAAHELIQYCLLHDIPVTPQGGNTGLVGGAVCVQPHGWLVNTSHLRERCEVDTANRTITASAGFTLAQVQEAAARHQLLFPLSLASEGSCTIGGNLATNAGGTAVLRYGNTRELTLGLEAILPDGSCWSDLRGLRKNNSGYDVKQLLIGSEGTLGLITTATLRLYSRPQSHVCAWLALDSIHCALQCLNQLLDRFDAQLTTFEWITHEAADLVCSQFGLALPTPPAHSYALVELSVFNTQDDTIQRDLLAWMEHQAASIGLHDAALAHTLLQREAMWSLRELISEAQARTGLNIKHDIALPISDIPDFLSAVSPQLQTVCPGARPIVFGHLGDGNLHFNVSAPADMPAELFLKSYESAINHAVYGEVHRRHGTLSAEHGIGLLKKDELARWSTPAQLSALRQIKQALDPRQLFNPSKIIDQ